jgi:DNA-directed RNA polymerase subunit RPC12/RpoP
MELSQGGGQPQQQLNINLAEQPDITCENCGGKFFEIAFMFKKVSKLLTGSPQDQIAPIQAYRCSDCGQPCEELLPEGLK